MPRPTSNPDNRFEEARIDWEGQPPPADLVVLEEDARSALRENRSPDLGFRFSVNPYQGCYHGCAYCYARRTHPYIGFGAGTDFERKIVVKRNVASLLRRELRRPALDGERLAFSGNTDCYQPLEAHYRLTRACLEACAAHGQAVGVVTKGTLVARDRDILSSLDAAVMISIAFADDATGRALDPYAPPIRRRLQTLETLSSAGIRTGVMVAPVIPGLNDADIPAILEAARDAGADVASMSLLRLPGEVADVFAERIEQVLPAPRVRKIRHAFDDVRGGRPNESRFGLRMTGHGPRWATIRALFETHRRRLGLDAPIGEAPQRPKRQLMLFDDL